MFPPNPTPKPSMSPIQIPYKTPPPFLPPNPKPHHFPLCKSKPPLPFTISQVGSCVWVPSMAAATGSSSPCGACKFLRRKCASDCIFAPYFCSEQGSARFAAIHKVFGASNVSKLLLHVPLPYRCEAVVTIAYEAQARIRDPVYGCVAHIFALQQQVAYLQAQLMQVRAQLAHGLVDSRCLESHWPGTAVGGSGHMSCPTYMHSAASQSSLDSMDYGNDRIVMQDKQSRELAFQGCCKKGLTQSELGELQALALRMMRN